MLVVIVPTMVAILPGVDLNASLAVVPLLNVSLICKEMIAGTWHWNYLVLIFGSACLYAVRLGSNSMDVPPRRSIVPVVRIKPNGACWQPLLAENMAGTHLISNQCPPRSGGLTGGRHPKGKAGETTSATSTGWFNNGWS